MKSPLHRSLTFWAGLLVIAFTCWAWRDSCTHVSGLQWKQIAAANTTHGIIITRSADAVMPLDHGRKPMPPRRHDLLSDPFPAPFLVRPHASPPDSAPKQADSLLKTGLQLSINYSPPGSWTLYLPYWIILLARLPAWSLLFLWRARRLKRASLTAS